MRIFFVLYLLASPMLLQKKYHRLQTLLGSLPSPFCIAVSGGLDSRFLTWTCHLMGLSFECIQLVGPHIPGPDSGYATQWLEGLDTPHATLVFDPLLLPALVSNPRTRCYDCKKAMFEKIMAVSARRGVTTFLEGSQASDLTAFRPGVKALRELGIMSPLALCDITKPEIRELAARTGLEWPDQPSRSCLLARFAYDLLLDHTVLLKVAGVESMLLELGLRAFKFRVLGREDFLLQVHPQESPMFEKHRALMEEYLADLGIRQWRVEVTTRLSGHFDAAVEGSAQV